MKKIHKGHKPNQAFGQSAKKSDTKTPGRDRGEMSKMPKGPGAAAKKYAKLKGVRI